MATKQRVAKAKREASPDELITTTISLTQGCHSAVAAAATERGWTLAKFIEYALRDNPEVAKVATKNRIKWSDRPRPGRPQY